MQQRTHKLVVVLQCWCRPSRTTRGEAAHTSPRPCFPPFQGRFSLCVFFRHQIYDTATPSFFLPPCSFLLLICFRTWARGETGLSPLRPACWILHRYPCTASRVCELDLENSRCFRSTSTSAALFLAAQCKKATLL